MTNQSEPVDLDFSKAKDLKPGDPVEVSSLSQMGGTFAERAAAREKAEKAQAKAVTADENVVEDKAVTRASTKARKPARKGA